MCGWSSRAIVRASRAKRSRERRVVLQVRVQHLDRDRPVERPMARPVDGAHPAGPDQLEAVEAGQPALELLGRQRRGPPAPAVGLRGRFPAQPRAQRAVGADAGRRIDGESRRGTPDRFAVSYPLLRDRRRVVTGIPPEYAARSTAMMTAIRSRSKQRRPRASIGRNRASGTHARNVEGHPRCQSLTARCPTVAVHGSVTSPG